MTCPGDVEIVGFTLADESDAITWWQRLRDLHPQTGLWPVVTTDNCMTQFGLMYADGFTWLRTRPASDEPASATELLAAGRIPSPAPDEISAWPTGAYGEDGEEDEDEGAVAEPYQHLIFNDFPGPGGPGELALVPAAGGWEVPLVVGFGSSNNCPAPYVHAGILQRWQSRWGADLFALDVSTLEFNVSRPPATREDAIQAALEHTMYHENGTEIDTLAELAAVLIDGPVWVAWWD